MVFVGFVLILYVLTVMRLVRLVTADTILDRFRLAIETMARDTDRPARNRAFWAIVSEFLGCPWCVGMWVSLGGAAVTVGFLGWPWWALIPLGLSCSQIVGMAAPLYSDEEIEFVQAQ